MSVTMVRYRVKADRLEENLKLVAAVYEELAAIRPGGLHYATFRDGPEGLNFVHVAVVDDGLDPHPLTSQPAFQRFSAGIYERCAVAPEAVVMDVVGSYSFFSCFS
jgi:hypothetical protein